MARTIGAQSYAVKRGPPRRAGSVAKVTVACVRDASGVNCPSAGCGGRWGIGVCEHPLSSLVRTIGVSGH